MVPENRVQPAPTDKITFREKARKTAIVLLLAGMLIPPFLMNVGINAQNAKLSGPLPELNRPLPSLSALLLSQIWALFASISPFNYTMHFKVELTDGRTVELHDWGKERAGKWQSVFFHNEPKSELNLYADHTALRGYMEYLIRTNGLDPSWVTHRTIYIRYWYVLPRGQAAAAGTHYGPEAIHDTDSY